MLPSSSRQTMRCSSRRLREAIKHGFEDEIPEHIRSVRQKMDMHERTSLHYACIWNSQLKTITLILEHYPESAKLQDAFNNTALHYATEYSSEEIISTIMMASPSSLLTTNNQLENPLHVAVRVIRSANIITKMMKTQPEAIFVLNKKGETPVDLFFKMFYHPVKAVVRLLPLLQSESSARIKMNYEKHHKSESVHQQIVNVDYVCKVSLSLLNTALGVNDEYLLHLSFQANTCPWIFSHLFAIVHPEQTLKHDQNNNISYQYFPAKNKKKMHNLPFKCDKCHNRIIWSKIFQFYEGKSTDGKFCECCFIKHGFNSEEYTTTSFDDELDELNCVYFMIREGPNVCAIMVISEMNEMLRRSKAKIGSG